MIENIAYRIKLLRGPISQPDFAKTIGVSLRAYKYYEAGTRMPPGKVLTKIAEVCGVTTDYILTGAEIPATHLDRVAEGGQPQYGDEITEKINAMLRGMDEEARRDVLKYVKKEKQISELRRREKKEAG